MNKSGSASLEETLSNAIKEHFSEVPTLLVGISGGPDSMALLYGLYKLGIEAVGVHINYGLRGNESDMDQELVEGMCFEWGFECCSVRLDSSESGNENFQNWARNERYRIFRELKKEFTADAIAISHHKDDQVETILQKLFRGSGPDTWTGMQMFDGELFRPLLGLSKEDILEYCEKNAVPYRVDGSNLESKYARNFLRREFSEQLNAFFPGWEENILKLPSFGGLNSKAISFITDSLVRDSELSLEEYNAMDVDLRYSVLKEFIERKAEGISLTGGLLKELDRLSDSQPGTEIPISENVVVLRERNSIIIRSGLDRKRQEINDSIREEQIRDGYHSNGLMLDLKKEIKFSDDHLTIDAGKLQYPLILRSWENGDRFQPLGMSGSQKISDHLANRKVRSSEKEKALILSGADGTIYALIFPLAQGNGQLGTISELVKCTGDTRMILEIKYRQAE